MDFDPRRRQPSPPPGKEEQKDTPAEGGEPEGKLTKEEIERRKAEIRARLMKDRRDRGEPGGLLDEYA